MALPFIVNFSVTDGVGKASSGRFYIDSAQTEANAITEATGLLGNIADMLTGRITQASVAFDIDPSTITNNPAQPDAQSNRLYKHRWSLQSAEGHESVLSIPAADQAESIDNTNNVDRSAASKGETLNDDILVRPLVTSHDEPITIIVKAVEVWGR